MSPPPKTAFMAVFLMVILSAAGVSGVPASAVASDPEVLYRGKPVSHWIALLQSEDAAVRRRAVASMNAIVTGIDAVIPVLGKAVEDEDQGVRLKAVEVLGVLGRSLKDAFPELIRSAQSEDLTVRLAGLQALREIAERRFSIRGWVAPACSIR